MRRASSECDIPDDLQRQMSIQTGVTKIFACHTDTSSLCIVIGPRCAMDVSQSLGCHSGFVIFRRRRALEMPTKAASLELLS